MSGAAAAKSDSTVGTHLFTTQAVYSCFMNVLFICSRSVSSRYRHYVFPTNARDLRMLFSSFVKVSRALFETTEGISDLGRSCRMEMKKHFVSLSNREESFHNETSSDTLVQLERTRSKLTFMCYGPHYCCTK